MLISRTDAVALCEALGFANAGKWAKGRMLHKLSEVKELAEQGGVEIEDDEHLADVLQQLVESDEVDVVSDDEAKVSKPKDKKATKAKQEPEPEEEEEEEEEEPEEEEEEEEEEEPEEEEELEEEEEDSADSEEEEVDETDYDEDSYAALKAKIKKMEAARKVEKEKAKKEKAERLQKNAGPKIGDGKVPGIRSTKNRLFYAGAVIARFGLEKGIGDELVDIVDELMSDKEQNTKASKTQLGLAWHALNGFLHADLVLDAKGKPLSSPKGKIKVVDDEEEEEEEAEEEKPQKPAKKGKK